MKIGYNGSRAGSFRPSHDVTWFGFRWPEDEVSLVQCAMQQLGTSNKSSFMRKAAVFYAQAILQESTSRGDDA